MRLPKASRFQAVLHLLPTPFRTQTNPFKKCVCEAMHPLSYMPPTSMPESLLVGNDNLALLDSNNDVVGALAVNSATNRVSSTEDFADTTREVLGERLVGHLTGNLKKAFD